MEDKALRSSRQACRAVSQRPSEPVALPREAGDTVDVTRVARIKDDLRAWRLGRCLFVGDAGMYSVENLVELSRELGRYILAEGGRARRTNPTRALPAGG